MKYKPFNDNQKKRIDRVIRMGNVRLILKDLNIKYIEKKRNDLWFKCANPLHKDNDPSTHICCDRSLTLHGIWHCLGCSDSGNIISLVKYHTQLSFWEVINWIENRFYEDHDVQPVGHKPSNIKPTLPPKYEFYKKIDKWNKPYLDYLFDRGITWEQIIEHKIGYCDSGKYTYRIIVPIYLNKELRTWVGRYIHNKRVTSCKGGKVGLFGSELANPKKGPAIISEGWADALAIERLNYANSMSCQTNKLQYEQFEFIKKFEFTIVVPDNDYGGKQFIDSLAQYTEQHEFLIAELPPKEDPASLILKEYGGVQLETAIQEAKEWNPVVEPRIIEFEF